MSGQAADSEHIGPMEVEVSQELEGMPSVLLGIPTVPRPKGMNYLEQTLQAILAQVDKEVSFVHACVKKHMNHVRQARETGAA